MEFGRLNEYQMRHDQPRSGGIFVGHDGGESGIRTHGWFDPSPVFKCENPLYSTTYANTNQLINQEIQQFSTIANWCQFWRCCPKFVPRMRKQNPAGAGYGARSISS